MATTVTRPMMLDSTGRELVDALANITISPTNIINNVTSYDTDKALAANQGRILDQSSALRVNTLKTETVGSVSAFSTSSVYAVGAYVTYNDLLYRCKKAVTTAGAWNAANWELVNLQELKTNIESAKRNMGELVYSSVPLTDAGLKLADGSAIASNSAYADFYNYIVSLYNSGSSAVITGTAADTGKYVYDSANSRIFLPNLNNLFIEGTTTASELGSYVAPGLPNITGKYRTSWGDNSGGGIINNGYWEGSLYGIKSGTAYYSAASYSGENYYNWIGLDASNSNSIYGNSGTVQPPAVKQYIYIVVANVVKTDYTVNIDNVMTDVNNLSTLINDLSTFEHYEVQPSDYYSYVNGSKRQSYTQMYRIGDIILIYGTIQIVSTMVVGAPALRIPKWKPSDNVFDAWCWTRANSSAIYMATYDRWCLNSAGDIYTTYQIDTSGADTRHDMFMFIYKI